MKTSLIAALGFVGVGLLQVSLASASVAIQAGDNPSHFDLFVGATSASDTITITKTGNSGYTLTATPSTGVTVTNTANSGNGNGKTGSVTFNINTTGSATAGANKPFSVVIHSSDPDVTENITASVYDHAVVTAPSVGIRLTQGQTGTAGITLKNLLNSSALRDGAAITAVSAASGGFSTNFSGTVNLAASDSAFNTGFTASFVASASNTVLSKTFSFTYGDQSSFTGQNANNQSASLVVTATVDKLSEVVNSNSGIAAGRTLLGSVNPIRTGTKTYKPGILTNINSGTGASKGTIEIDMSAVSGQTAEFGTNNAVILLDFTNTTNLSALTTDLSSFGYSYNITGTGLLTGAFSSYDLQLNLQGVTGATSYFDFDYSKYGLNVVNAVVVPEPASISFIALFSTTLLVRRRRSKI